MRRPRRRARDGGQEIVLLGFEDVEIGSRAGRDDADDLAANELFAGAGRLHLIADGDFEAGTQEPGD